MISLRDIVMIHDLKKQGLSNTAVAGQLGISRRTVERRLKRGLEAPVYGPRAPKPRQIEPFEAYLRDRVTSNLMARSWRAIGSKMRPGGDRDPEWS